MCEFYMEKEESGHLGRKGVENRTELQWILRTATDQSFSNSMESPSWAANSCSASQEIPRFLWNPNVQYRVHKNLPLALSFTIRIQSTTFHPISLRSVLILSYYPIDGYA
jgi:hypothetical protein